MKQKRFDATKIHTHTFALDDLPEALRYAKERIDDAIKVVVKAKTGAAQKVAAEWAGLPAQRCKERFALQTVYIRTRARANAALFVKFGSVAWKGRGRSSYGRQTHAPLPCESPHCRRMIWSPLLLV